MKKITLADFYKKIIFIAFVGLCATLKTFGQCPTITNSTQSFCDTEAPMIANLSATDNGGGVYWYDSATSTTPLSSTFGLINGRDYFVDDKNGSCTTREKVTVKIYGRPAALDFQGVCVDAPEEATVADLFASGNDIQWYNVPTGGSPLPSSMILVDNSYYYVDQSNPASGCRTSRRSVLINVGVVPVPTGSTVQTFCADPQPTVADLVASGTNNWYSTVSSGTPLPLETVLVSGETYYATSTDLPCESDERLEVTVEIVPVNDAGKNGIIEICETGISGTVNLFEALIGTPETRGKWTGPLPTANGHIGTVDVSGLTLAGSPYVFSYKVTSDFCPTSTATVSIVIIESADAGLDGEATFCSNDAPKNLFDSLKGTPEGGGLWSPALAGGNGIFDPSVDAPGIYTYTVNGVLPCGEASATVNVKVNAAPNPGTNGSVTLCFEASQVDLIKSLGGNPQTGGTWSPAFASGTGIFNPSVDKEGTYTYTVNGVAPCDSSSSTVTVSIIPLPDAGQNGTLVVCSNDGIKNLFESLNGTPVTGGTWSPALASGSGLFNPAVDAPGTYTYSVKGTAPCGEASATVQVTVNKEADPGTNGSITLCFNSAPTNLFGSLGGTPDAGGTWSPALASNSGVFDPSVDKAGTYTYTVKGIAPCGDASSTVTVSINPEPDAGEDGTLVVCENDSPQDLFDSLNGTPETGGTWTPALKSGTGIFDPSQDAAGLYTYTVKGVSPCGEATATVNVTINPSAQPGTNGSLALCADSPSENLFDSLGGNPEAGGVWSPALASGTGMFNPKVDAAGVYTYTVSGISPCGDASATVTVTINPLPDAGSNGFLEICSNGPEQDLFASLNGTPEAGGTWSPALASGTGIFNPAVDVAGSYTYTVKGLSPCGEASAQVRVSVTPAADPGTNGSLTICADGTAENLFTYLGGTPETGGTWSPALASGTGIFDPAVDAEGTYTYTLKGIAPCGDMSSTITVSILKAPDAGISGILEICSNDAPQDLFNSLGGNPTPGGVWSPALTSGSGIFDPQQDRAEIYTYTVTNKCGVNTSTVRVSIKPQPDITGIALEINDICLEDALFVQISGATLLEDGTYNLNYSLSGANISEETISISITNGNARIIIPSSQLTNTGTTTLTIINLEDPVTNCGSTVTNSPKASFTIEQAETPELVENGNSFCIDDAPTIASLTSNLIGGNLISWYDALENGNEYTADTPLVDGTTYYASNSTINGCSNGVRLAITVKIDSCEPLTLIIPDGFSPNGDGINDNFNIKNLRALYPNFKLQIYNRYGNILYKGDTNNNDWDGTANQGREMGKGVLPVGVYFYILELNDTTAKTIQGSVYLNR